jgi:hypothetical protein
MRGARMARVNIAIGTLTVVIFVSLTLWDMVKGYV